MKNDRPLSFEKVREFFRSGELWEKTPSELTHCLRALASGAEENPYIRHHHIIIASAIHGILLERLLILQEKRNQKAQFWFMVLAIAGVCAAISQLVVPIILQS
jgi:hypothetical protein